MYPENNQPINPSDYLNQISTPPTQPRMLNFLNNKPILFGLVGLGSIIAIILIAVIIGSLTSGNNPTEQLAAKLIKTQEIAESTTGKIKSTELRALNSNLKILLTNTARDAEPIFKSEKIDIKKLDKKVLEKESNSKTLEKLEDARLNAIYDRTYAREMAYQLDKVLSLMKQIYSSSKNEPLKHFLDTSYDNLAPIQKQLADFNSARE